MAVGSTMVNLNSSIIASILLALPPIGEQEIFEQEIKAAHKRIDTEKCCLEKLLSEKAGLMDDLLSGRVRVTPLLEQEKASAR